jgi:signal transduction histidine kinase
VQQGILTHIALKAPYLVILDGAGNVIHCGNAVGAVCTMPARNASSALATVEQFRVLSATRYVRGAPYVIRVVSDLSFQTAILRHFFYWLLIVAPAALASSALGGYWLSGRALKPVRGIISEVHVIGEQNLGMRLRTPKTGDEIQVLSETLNVMLDRIERAFRQVTEITTNVSHELRTPVTVIRASAEIALLNARPTVESHRRALQQICEEAEKSTNLLDGILMLARAESGVQPLHFSELSLAKSVAQSLNTCQHLAEAKRISLSCQEDRSDIQLWADPGHLNRLWILLLDNAIKYTSTGGRVTARLMLSAEAEPVCEISDNGIGIEEKDLSSIFERFYRTKDAKLTANTGYGLGLAIARRIAEMHHATIGVSSIQGAGSIFRVTFKAGITPATAVHAHDTNAERFAIAAS